MLLLAGRMCMWLLLFEWMPPNMAKDLLSVSAFNSLKTALIRFVGHLKEGMLYYMLIKNGHTGVESRRRTRRMQNLRLLTTRAPTRHRWGTTDS